MFWFSCREGLFFIFVEATIITKKLQITTAKANTKKKLLSVGGKNMRPEIFRIFNR